MLIFVYDIVFNMPYLYEQIGMCEISHLPLSSL